MTDIAFGIRVTADGRVAVENLRPVGKAIDDIGDGAKRASGALDTFKGALAALQIDRFITDAVRGFSQAIQQTIGFAASLDDLAEATGSSVENLSGLANQARVSGVSFGTIESALSRLSTRLSAADDDSKRAGAALRALGVDARDPAEAFRQVAIQLDKYADGYEKAALVNEIFGRGASTVLLPLLKDMAREQEIGTRITAQQAAEAEALEKAWRGLTVQAQTFLNTAILPLVAGLNEYIRTFTAARTAGLGLFKADALAGMAPEALASEIKRVTEEVARFDAMLDKGKREGIGSWVRTAMTNLKPLQEELAILHRRLNAITSGRADANGLNFPEDSTTGGRPAAPRVPGGGGGGSTAAADRAARERRRLLEQDAAGWVRAIEAMEKAWNDEAEAIRKANELLERDRRKLLESDVQGWIRYIEELERQWHDEAKAIEAGTDAARRRDEELADKQRKANERMVEENARAAERMGDDITDALMRGFESGADFARNFKDTLSNMFRTLVLRPIIQAVVAPIAGGFSGMMSGAASASGGGFGGLFSGGGGGFGNFGQIGNLLGGGFGAFGSAFSGATAGAGAGAAAFGLTGGSMLGTGAGFFSGLSAPMATMGSGFGALAGGAGMTGALGAMGGIAGAVGAAVPIIGIGLAIASALGAFDKSVPKTGGSGGAAINLAGGGWNLDQRMFTPNDSDAAVQAMVQDVGAAFRETARTLGAANQGVAEFLLGYDAHEEHGNRVSSLARFNGRDLYSAKDVSVGDDPADIQAALALEAKRVVLSALQASELPEQIARVLDSVVVETANEEEIDRAIKFGAAMRTVMQALEGSVAEDAAEAIAASQRSVVENLALMGSELSKLAAEQDGSVESMQALAQATVNYRQALAQTLVAIKQIERGVDQMIAGMRETIETTGLSGDEAYEYYRERANQAADLIATTEDPALVEAYAQQANRYFMLAWNSLPTDEQLAMKPEFLSRLNVLDAVVDSTLARITTSVQESSAKPLESVGAALDAAGDKFTMAGDEIAGAAIALGDAVDTFGAWVSQLPAPTMVAGPKRAQLINA